MRINQSLKNEGSLSVKQVLRVSRPNLGTDMPVSLWRLLRLVAMPRALGAQTKRIENKIGREMGKLLVVKTPKDIVSAINNSRIGLCRPLEHEGEKFSLEFTECFTCSGIAPIAGRAICDFEVAMVQGAFQKIGYKIKDIKETKCMGGLGDTVCRIELSAKLTKNENI